MSDAESDATTDMASPREVTAEQVGSPPADPSRPPPVMGVATVCARIASAGARCCFATGACVSADAFNDVVHARAALKV